ncbi:MAG: DUF2867 domain-containing protein [Rhodothermaceae bacterium]|nr:DUF2867 domain-containing protein [Rhodothermaceae bacterium]
MSDVVTTALPPGSILHARLEKSDFIDCYSVKSCLPPRRAAEIITDFPDWARFLLRARRVVTMPFGLINDGPPALDKVGMFPVEIESGRELVAGFDDKHLDFRVSVMSYDGLVFLATWVHPHNIGGRLYLGAVMPFHVMISRNALARVRAAGAPR